MQIDIGYRSFCDRLFCQGNEILKYRIEIPLVHGYKEINEFYLSIAKQCESYCREKLFLLLCERADMARYTYKLSCRAEVHTEKVISVAICARIYKKDELLREFLSEEMWELENQEMIPKINAKKSDNKCENVKIFK